MPIKKTNTVSIFEFKITFNIIILNLIPSYICIRVVVYYYYCVTYIGIEMIDVHKDSIIISSDSESEGDLNVDDPNSELSLESLV